MLTAVRRREIAQIALVEGKVEVASLAELFAVSDVTIRTDLNVLDKMGVLLRTRGGALARNGLYDELPVIQKQERNAEIKRLLAERVCDYVADGDSLIVDSGSTTAEVARALHRFDRLTVLTNGLNVAQNLACVDGIEVMMTGGTLRSNSQSFYGSHAENCFALYSFDKLILGVDGYDFVAGITTHFEHEASLNRRMLAAARQVIAITDSSKFERAGVHKICDFSAIDVLVTDSGIPDKFASAFEASGIELAIVER